MALPVLDGNQSATTLSSVITGGEHIVAHTVVSLGSTAISNITSAVSGSVVSVSNFPSTQTIAGTVTANVPNADTFIKPAQAGGFGDTLEPDDDNSAEMCVAVHVRDLSGAVLGANKDFPISGTVTVGNSTTASAVAVRLIAEDTNPGGSGAGVNVNLYSNDNALLVDALKNGNSVLGYDGLSSYVQVKPAIGSSVTIGSLPAISGTVTANVVGTRTFLDLNAVTVSGFLAVGGWDAVNSRHAPIPVNDGATGVRISYDDASGVPVKVGLPSGALTTRFGSVTTANTAQITSAVTNTSRKYLLAQNISAGTVTIGIGFSPTTTQGIQLPAGGGLTFDAFCPTGAVYWLGAVTGAAYTILEG